MRIEGVEWIGLVEGQVLETVGVGGGGDGPGALAASFPDRSSTVDGRVHGQVAAGAVAVEVGRGGLVMW